MVRAEHRIAPGERGLRSPGVPLVACKSYTVRLDGAIQQIVGCMDEEQIVGADADDVFVLSPQKGPVFFVFGEIRFYDEDPRNDASGDEREISPIGSIGHRF